MKQTDIERNITTFILSCPRRFAKGNTKISAAKKSNQFQMSSDRFIGDFGGQDQECLFFCKHLENVTMEITLNKRENTGS